MKANPKISKFEKREYEGKTKRLGEWAKLRGLTMSALSWRMSHGWTWEETLEVPKHSTREAWRKRKQQHPVPVQQDLFCPADQFTQEKCLVLFQCNESADAIMEMLRKLFKDVSHVSIWNR